MTMDPTNFVCGVTIPVLAVRNQAVYSVLQPPGHSQAAAVHAYPLDTMMMGATLIASSATIPA